MSNIREVAKEAGVSITTVSKILSNDPSFRVSEGTRKRVIQAVKDLNYQYAAKNTQLHIGCIMSLTYSYSDPYFNNILSGIQSFCSTHNAVISLVISYSQFLEAKNSLEKQLSELDGLIITELMEKDLDFINRLNNEIVFVDTYFDGYCNIGYNDVYSNQLVMNHIIDCGYRKIAHIGGYMHHGKFDSSARMMVFREILRQNDIPFDPDLIYDCQWDNNLCAVQVQELIKKKPDTEVIFAGSDSLAFIILSQLNKMGIRCPEDIGVIGFNDVDMARNYTPPLTTLHLPSLEMGEIAARVLIDQITSGVSQKCQILLPVELKVRKSTRNIRE